MICECGHTLEEHDKNDGLCLADINQKGKRLVFCKCKGFKPISQNNKKSERGKDGSSR